MRRYGYDPYHGRSRGRTALKILIGVLLCLLVLAVAALLFLEPYIHYTSDGVRVELPFFQGKGEEPDPPEDTTPLQLTTPSPSPTNTPEPEADFRGVLLPAAALTDGTAQSQVDSNGGTAAIFSMKGTDGALGYQSQTTLDTSSEQEGINEAIQTLNGGELYTVAWLSCFRDNTLPWNNRALGIHSNSGNWRDDESIRWSSPAVESVRTYVAQVCGELAGLGFDELLLDNCGFPTRGTVSYIKSDSNYDPDTLTQTMETFFQTLDQTMEQYPAVKVSVVTSLSVLNGGSDGSGLTLDLLKQYADKVYVQVPEGETIPTIEGLEIVPIVAQGTDTGSWAVLS
ncbi:hypothetical protein B5G34_12295 [Flavonifractor sp. An82]|uniref:putative glycoside hydrolase n=1 Tax=Flavonifractor sp. An82 TaxID=1965660 RepID=UPI000B382EFC|nr:putative glycoside hydrolase [Flavonifractor sp. An82]OUN21125.1 hypothetical protein B5G34_12295 [Flavonifractor sp. An82]